MKNLINCPFDEMMIYSKNLEVPRNAYQRELNPNRVRKIAAEFDEHIANDPKVSFRDGHYYVLTVSTLLPPGSSATAVRTCPSAAKCSMVSPNWMRLFCLPSRLALPLSLLLVRNCGR